jgi:hypothetical protein
MKITRIFQAEVSGRWKVELDYSLDPRPIVSLPVIGTLKDLFESKDFDPQSLVGTDYNDVLARLKPSKQAL